MIYLVRKSDGICYEVVGVYSDKEDVKREVRRIREECEAWGTLVYMDVVVEEWSPGDTSCRECHSVGEILSGVAERGD